MSADHPSIAEEPEGEVRSYFAHPNALVESENIGARTRVWAFAHVMKGAQLGADCNVCEHAFIEDGVRIGDNVTIKNGVSLWTGITIEDNVFLGPHCVFTNDRNPRSFIKKGRAALVGTRICGGATVGAGSVIVAGNEIGHFAFVGAGAVVTRQVPDFALVVGNPARQIGWMCLCADKLPFDVNAGLGQHCTCAKCGRQFERISRGLSVVTSSPRPQLQNPESSL